MTKRLTVSVPDDVADYLDGKPNASAAVTEAVRAHMKRGAAVAAILRAAGYNITDEGIERTRGKLPRRLSPAQRAESRRRYEAIQNGTYTADIA
jgi:hypothetical protein